MLPTLSNTGLNGIEFAAMDENMEPRKPVGSTIKPAQCGLDPDDDFDDDFDEDFDDDFEEDYDEFDDEDLDGEDVDDEDVEEEEPNFEEDFD